MDKLLVTREFMYELTNRLCTMIDFEVIKNARYNEGVGELRANANKAIHLILDELFCVPEDAGIWKPKQGMRLN